MPCDYRGRPFSVGQTIVYALRRGSRLWLSEAIVREVHPDHLVVDRTHPAPAAGSPRATVLRSMSTVVIMSGGAE